MKKINIITVLGFVLAFLVSCAQTEFDSIPVSKLMGDSLVSTYSIEKIQAEFMTDSDAYSDTTNYLGGLYTADKIDSLRDVVFSGYVTSTDNEGNIYKYIVIQEDSVNGRAIRVSIDASGLSALYPLGQKVWVKCNGLYIGKYGQCPQIGLKYINKDRIVIKKSTQDTIYRIEPGRIPLVIAKKQIHAYGIPDTTKIIPDTMTIAQIKASDPMVLVNKLVCIKNAYFNGKSDTDDVLESQMIFAPSTNGAGYPQLRDIQDKTGTISIATSEYAKFASYVLPSSKYRGDITVIVGWYKNYKNATGTWQLTLRRLSDLGKGFEDYRSSVQ